MKWLRRILIIYILLFLGISLESEDVPKGEKPEFVKGFLKRNGEYIRDENGKLIYGVTEKEYWMIGTFYILPKRDFDSIINN
jgi:hypothetical protein